LDLSGMNLQETYSYRICYAHVLYVCEFKVQETYELFLCLYNYALQP